MELHGAYFPKYSTNPIFRSRKRLPSGRSAIRLRNLNIRAKTFGLDENWQLTDREVWEPKFRSQAHVLWDNQRDSVRLILRSALFHEEDVESWTRCLVIATPTKVRVRRPEFQ